MGRDLQGGVRGGGHEINGKVSKEVVLGRPQVPVLRHGLEQLEELDDQIIQIDHLVAPRWSGA